MVDQHLRKLGSLLEAARAVSSDCEVRFRGTPQEQHWVCLVSVGGAILYESNPGPVHDVMDSATCNLKSVSRKMLAALAADCEGPPSSNKKSA